MAPVCSAVYIDGTHTQTDSVQLVQLKAEKQHEPAIVEL
jgi:hypothetical protein